MTETKKRTRKPTKPKEVEISVLGQMILDAKKQEQDKQSKIQLP